MKNYKRSCFSKWLLIFVFFTFVSCNRQIKFDKNRWNEQADPVFPSSYRPKMLNDLITNNRLIGLRYHQLIELLGIPDNKDSSFLSYKIVVEYGSDIDPVYTKDLKFTYSRDSLINSFKVIEWKK